MSSDQGWGQGWTLIVPLLAGGGQFSALIFLALVMSHGGVLVESVVVVSPPRPLPQDRPLPIPKNRPRIRPSPASSGLSLWFAFPSPENPGNRALAPKSVSSTRKMTTSGSKSAESRPNQAILSANSAVFTQIYRYITNNNHYQQRSDYVEDRKSVV